MSTPNPAHSPSIRHAAAPVDAQPFADVIACLRAPDGCPWDREQTHESLARYAVEETYELVDAIRDGDDDALREELGDVLLQVVLHAQLAADRGAFTLQDVFDGVRDKMLRRHPHVFGDEEARSRGDVIALWDQAKRAEGRGLLEGVPRSMPPLLQFTELARRAAKVGFDFPDVSSALGKVREEVLEVVEAVASDAQERIQDEIGDLVFAAANLARKAGVDVVEAALGTATKFRRRFGAVERAIAASGRDMTAVPLEDLEAEWQRAKREEGDPVNR